MSVTSRRLITNNRRRYFYPLSNTATDPVSATWLANYDPVEYEFTPNEGIRTYFPITSMANMFAGNTTFNDPDINLWDVSGVTSFLQTFDGCSSFNQPLSNWNTSASTNFGLMFKGCTAFNQNVNTFDLSNAITINNMFHNATNFNNGGVAFAPARDGTTNCQMASTFQACTSLTVGMSGFNTTNITLMNSLFNGCTNFNQPLSTWDVSTVSSMLQMFNGATIFNQDLSDWNTPLISEEPTDFALNSALTEANKPWWVATPGLRWQVDTTLTGNSASDQFRFYINTNGASIDIDWGDGTSTNQTSYNGEITHTYTVAGIYKINVSADTALPSVALGRSPSSSIGNDQDKVTNVIGWKSGYAPQTTQYLFAKLACTDYGTAIETAQIQNVTNMSSMFADTSGFNESISSWDVSAVTTFASMFNLASAYNNGGVAFAPTRDGTTSATMQSMFSNADAFNVDVSGFNTANVTSFSSCFSGCDAFNQSINAWNLSSATSISNMFGSTNAFNNGGVAFAPTRDGSTVCSMFGMFQLAPQFNVDVSGFNTSNVNNMASMFWTSPNFNQSINNWNMSSVTACDSMFDGATNYNNGGVAFAPTRDGLVSMDADEMFRNTAINVDMSGFNTTNITDFSYMFAGCDNFNQDLSAWDTSSANSFAYMFEGATSFNNGGNPLTWTRDGSTSADPYRMFAGCTAFNAPVDGMNMSNMTSFAGVFSGCINFNQPVNSWDTSSATSMFDTFNGASSFNQPLNNWDTSNVSSMISMFNGATNFNQDLTDWQVPLITSEPGNFSANSALIESNKPWWGVTTPGLRFTVDTTLSGVATDYRIGVQAAVGSEVTIEWGDGSTDVFNTQVASHTKSYATGGTYSINVSCVGTSYVTLGSSIVNFNTVLDGDKVIAINGWKAGYQPTSCYGLFGRTGSPTCDWTALSKGGFTQDADSMRYMFAYSTLDAPVDWIDLSSSTNIASMFSHCFTFNHDISSWDVSNIYDFRYMFLNATSFNNGGQPFAPTRDGTGISIMSNMFDGASAFNAPMKDFNTTNVTSMANMFAFSSFNQPIGNWDVSSVTDMDEMFRGTPFNQHINNWDVSNVVDMSLMFMSTTAFNKPLNKWNTANVQTFTSMFSSAAAFNQPIGNWDVGAGTKFNYMFYNSPFNQPLNDWNIGADASVITVDMGYMFYLNTAFNQDLHYWDTSKVTTMSYMFNGATAFNGNITQWDTSAVTNMSYMFSSATSFNQPITNWDTSSVMTMYYMFYNADAFNQDISHWDVSSCSNFGRMFSQTTSFNCGLASGVAHTRMNRTEWGGWMVDAVTNDSGLQNMFSNALAWAGDLSNWNVPNNTAPANFSSGASGNQVDPVWGSSTIAAAPFQWACELTITATDVSVPQEFRHSTVSSGTVDVDWGDGASESITSGTSTFHTYSSEGVYVVRVTGGTVSVARFGKFSSQPTMTRMLSFGDGSVVTSPLYNMTGVNLAEMPPALPSAFTSLGDLIYTSNYPNASAFDALIGWNVSNITDFVNIFRSTTANSGSPITVNLSRWNTRNVTDMDSAFYNVTTFNGDITGWDTSNVTNMSNMFNNADSFNQPIGNWNVSKVTNFASMFQDNGGFNQPLNTWKLNTAAPVTMASMFRSASAFNQDLHHWDTSQVTNMYLMFYLSPFNGNISSWDVSNVTTFRGMFQSATAFNGDIRYWDTSSATNMYQMFYDATSFNCGEAAGVAHDHMNRTAWGGWQVEGVVDNGGSDDLGNMFFNASSWNGNLDGWAVSTYSAAPGGNGFATGATSWTENQPVWGTAPFPNAPRLWAAEITTTTTDELVTIWTGTTASGMHIIWGDGSETTDGSGAMSHTYSTAGTYTMYCTAGTAAGIGAQSSSPFSRVLSFDESGIVQNGYWACRYGSNLSYIPPRLPTTWVRIDDICVDHAAGMPLETCSGWNTKNIQIMNGAFERSLAGGHSFVGVDLSRWDVSSATDMGRMFYNAISFNGDISGWDVSNVAVMSEMFYNADAFNQSINNWDMSSVNTTYRMFRNSNFNNGGVAFAPTRDSTTAMTASEMFRNCNSLTVDMSDFNTANITNFSYMFADTANFNGSLAGWDTSDGATFAWMFYNTDTFNQNISHFDFSSAASITYILADTVAFNNGEAAGQSTAPLTFKNLGGVTNFARCLTFMPSFNQDISSWDTSSATSFSYMFRNTPLFNQDISNWNTSNVLNMELMFEQCDAFNQDISGWDTAKVQTTRLMFSDALAFNQDISGWDVSSVTDCGSMFNGAAAYNQDLSGLYFSSVVTEPVSFSTGATAWVLPKPKYNNLGVPTTITT